MQLALDAGEQEIANAAQSFLSKEFPLERLHGAARTADGMSEFADLGWLGLTAPEAMGGSGLSVVEEMLFFLEMGRNLGPMGILSQMLAVATADGSPELCGQLITGELRVAQRVDVQSAEGIRLIGGENSTHAVAITPTQATLYELDIAACREVTCLDRSVNMFVGEISALKPVAERRNDEVWLRAQIDVSAMMVGIAGRALDMIVEYARTRETFGRPIGSYQAVRHPCSDMAVRVEVARCQLYYAATALKEQHADARIQVDAARLVAQRAVRENTDTNIQLHGGIGVTDEFDAHLLLKRANLLWRLLGSEKSAMGSLLTIDTDSGSVRE